MLRSKIRSNSEARRAALCLAGLACALLAPIGCSSNDSGLGLQPICVDFRPDREPTPGDVVARVGAGSTCDTAEVELAVTGVQDVYGTRFTVEYDPLNFVLLLPVDVEGSFLTEGGAVEVLVVPGDINDPNYVPGQVVVGVTRAGVPDGVTPTEGNDLLATLRFFRVGTVDSDLEFTSAELRDSATDPGPQPIPVGEWVGGRLDVH